jgi:hypothetical protein
MSKQVRDEEINKFFSPYIQYVRVRSLWLVRHIKLIRYRAYQTPNLHRTYRIPKLSIIEFFVCKTHQMPILSDTKLVGYRAYQI